MGRINIIKVDGIHCEGCAITIRNGLLSLNGVSNVNVVTNEGKVIVVYDPDKTSYEEIKSTIRSLGYEVK
ncbi:MAG: cation transporter [Desulfurococcales archaeon]|nr:cation transporter [Desulfurococcales archaeon]